MVGAGASGTFQALHLLQEGADRVTLIEREREPGRGTAYGTRRSEHLLNVPARRMSVYPDDPDDFARWLAERGGGAEDFARREQFGDYLSALLEAAGERIRLLRDHAVDVSRSAGEEEVALRGGAIVTGDAVVLAMGNLRPAIPAGIEPATLGPLWVEDPWFGDYADDMDGADTVLLVGTGLTAVDAALTLEASGFAGTILALSRRGLVPRSNLRREPVAEPLTSFPGGAVELLKSVRRRGEAIGWREAVHEVRQAARQLWAATGLDERQRFLRHLRPWWDVHRHRIAPSVAERIEALECSGRLRFDAGRIVSAEPHGGDAVVTWQPRGRATAERIRVARIINCTGPELDIARAGEPLLDALIAAGRVRPDPCRLGIDVDQHSRALDRSGQPSDSLFAIGPMTRGAFWESIAVSDIAAQAQAVARRITGGSRSGS